MKRKIAISILLLGLAFLSTSSAWASCTAHSNSSAFEGSLPIGPYCGDTGAGCTECIEWNPGPGIFFSVCYYDWGGIYCYTYGAGGWENQGL